MTIICALRDRGETWVGCDGQVTGGQHIYPGSIRKWNFSADGWYALASAGDVVIRNALSALVGEMTVASAVLQESNAVEISRRLRGLLKENDVEKNHDKLWPNEFIVAGRDGIFDIASDLAVHRIPDGILWARGSGENYAMGAAHATLGDNPMARVRYALEAACAFSTSCGGELFVHRLGDTLP